MSAPAFVREPLAGVLTFQLDADPRTLTRAFLVYEVSGLQHWTATSRSINRGPLRSAYRPSSGAAGGTQVEEIAPTWLRRGLNQVQFRPVDANDPVGYRVQHLRVVGYRGATTEAPTVAADAVRQALIDGDPTTGTLAQGRGADPTWSLGSSGTVHEIDLLVTRPWNGTLDLLSTVAGRAERRRVLSGPTSMGWQRLRIDPPVSAEQATLSIRGAGEQQGFIAEARLVGGAIREHVDPALTLTWPVHGECVGQEVHIQGFATLRSGDPADARLYVANHPVDVRLQADGAFALSVPSVRAGDLTVELRMPDGRRASRVLAMDDCTEPPPAATGSGLRLGTITDDPGAPFGQWVRAHRAASLSLGGIQLEIPAQAVERDTRITVRPLTPGQVPPLEPGMTNVSPEGKGFRLGPHGTHFARAIHLTLPYDHDRLPRGTTDADVGIYYYNDRTGHWASVTRLGQERGARVVAASDHFTDFISATLAAPDSPQAASFNPNAMRDLDPGDPAAGVTVIAPPEASSSGGASLHHPIVVPAGRRGIQPSLAIAYNSEHENGPLGVGWNLELPRVEVDTRFGVPRYDGTNERYLLSGEAIVPVGAPSGGVTTFRRRVEGRFERILRHGTNASDYWWEVTDRNGTRYSYGQTSSARLSGTPTNGIFRWMLQEVVDTFGNRMVFVYRPDTGNALGPLAGGDGEPWKQLYPDYIAYTSHLTEGAVDLEPNYRVQFYWSADPRPDVISSARSGFDIRTRKRLDRLDVFSGTTVVRRYQLDYTTGEFHKSLLASIKMFGLNGEHQLYGHVFDYTTVERDSGGRIAFSSPQPWTVQGTGASDPAARAIHPDQSSDSSGGMNAFVGLGPPWCSPHVGGGAGVSGGVVTSAYQMADVNGDGLPDILAANGLLALNSFVDATRTTGQFAPGSQQSPAEVRRTHQTDVTANFAGHFFNEAGLFGADFSWNQTGDRSMLTDVDGDGLADVIRGPFSPSLAHGPYTLDVFLNPFGYTGGGARDTFGVAAGTAPPTRDYQLGGFEPPVSEWRVDSTVAARLRSLFHPVDPLVRWIAPYRGRIKITGPIIRVGAIGEELEGEDGVHVSILRATGQSWDLSGVTLAGPVTEVWKKPLSSTDPCTPASGDSCGAGLELEIEQGDRLYFRVHGMEDPRGDTTQWSPEIEYIREDDRPCEPVECPTNSPYCADPPPCGPRTAPHPLTFRFATDFRLASPDIVGWTAPVAGKVTITGNVQRLSTAPALDVNLYHRRVVWPATTSSPHAWFFDPTHVVTSADLAEMRAARASGALQHVQDGPYPLATIPAGDPRTTIPILYPLPFAGVGAGDQLVLSLQIDSGTDPASVRWNPLVTYTDVTLPHPAGGSVSSAIGSCTEDTPGGPSSSCALVTAIGSVDRLPQSVVARTAIPAIGYRAPVIERHDPMHGIWTEAWYTTSTDGRPVWDTWAYGAWNGNIAFSEDSTQLRDADAASTARFAALEGGGALTPISLVPVIPQFSDIPARDRIVPELTVDAWASMGAGAYVTSGVWRPGRMGNLRITHDARVIPYGSTTMQSSNAPGLRRSSGHNNGPASTLVVSSSANEGESDGELEFIDFNGDRVPDSVNLGGVQIQGNHQFATAVPLSFSFGALRRTSTSSYRIAVGAGSGAAPLSNQNTAGGSHEQTSPSMPSYGTVVSESTTAVDLIDINADGLPDSVRTVGSGGQYWLEVQLNLGYRLGAPSRIQVPFAGGQFTFANPLALATEHSESISLQFGFAGIGGGPRKTRTRGETRFIDINGDQLPDKVTKSSQEAFFRVQINQGERFADEVQWTAPAWPAGTGGTPWDSLRATSGTSYSNSIGVPMGVSFAFVCLVAELSAQVNSGTADTDIEMMDIDGDGHVDQVRRDGNTLLTRRNPTAGSNLLRTVTQPLGGSFELSYRREGNRVGVATDGTTTPVNMPRQQWVLAEVSRHDRPAGPVANHTRFEYFSSGFYDRVERESYGYAHVRTTREDDSTVDVRYHNQDYYRNGLPYEVTEANAAGALFHRTRTTYATPTGALPLSGTFFPASTLEELSWYEATTTDPAAPLKVTQRHRVYDSYGSLTEMRDDGDTGTDDDVIYTITPHSDLTHWIFGVESIVATSSTGTILRRRDSHQRADGAMDSLTEFIYGGREPISGVVYNGASTQRAVTTLDYDAYGNVRQATDPSGFTLIYTYDPVTQTYRDSTLDGFGYSSVATYDLRFGVPVSTTDRNGREQTISLDEFGRVKEVFSPTEVGTGVPTVHYDYSLGDGTGFAYPSWVRVRNKDDEHPGDPIDTVIFADGYGRVIQTKRDAEVDDGVGGTIVGMNVSGSVGFDARGRTTRVGQGIFDTGPQTAFVTVPETNPVVSIYDPLSRVVDVMTPDFAHTTTSYGATTLDGVLRLTTTATDALSRPRIVYHDVRNQRLAVQEQNTIAGTLTQLVTRYRYDPLGRLTKVTDANGHETHATYDSRGLMVSLQNPDAGRTEYRYTLGGDLGARETPELRANGALIRYDRTWHRLDRVDYPNSTDTWYSYGPPGASGNTAGRLSYQYDASGATAFAYGALGELVSTWQSLNAPPGSVDPIQATTLYHYDSFGRMREVTYPDGTQLTYRYNAGGQLRRLEALRGATSWNYIDQITYDSFDQRASIRYGNGVETRYAYRPDTRRLSEVNTSAALGTTIQALRFNYNQVGNIIWSDNVASTYAAGFGGAMYQDLFYDDLNQLTSAVGRYWPTSGSYREYTLSMGYDAIGNITQKTQNDSAIDPATWTYSTQWQTSYAQGYGYAGPRPHAPTTVGSRSFTYDANGNQTGWTDSTTSSSRTLTWDEEDRVSAITTDGLTTSFLYNGDGRRTHKFGPSGTSVYVSPLYTVRNGLVPTRHVFAGEQRIASTVMPDGAASSTQKHYYYHTNHLQSTQVVTNEAGQVTEHMESFPYGEGWIDESASSDRVAYRFSANEVDAETGLYDFGARQYDPRQSQWVSVDPVLAEFLTRGGHDSIFNAISLSLYAYSWNCPLVMRDPDGRDPILVRDVIDGASNFVTGAFLAVVAPNYTRMRPLGGQAIPYDIGQLLGHAVWVLGGAATTIQGGANVGSAAVLASGSGGSATAPALALAAAGAAQATAGVAIASVGLNGMGRDARDLLSHMSGDEGNPGRPPPNSGAAPTTGMSVSPGEARNLPEAVGSQEVANSVNEVLRGRQPLSVLSQAQRESAAEFFRAVAGRVVGNRPEMARLFNLARARYLAGETTAPPLSFPEFVAQSGGR